MKRISLAVAMLLVLGQYTFAQDPVKVSPEHYKIVLENDRVRVLRGTRGPHEIAPMHSHPEYVAVYLTDVDQKITLADGTVQEVHRKAGETSHSNAITHSEENLADKPLEVVVIELKKKPAGAAMYKFDPATDPTKLDSKYHTVDYENENVRILRTKLEPHIPAPMHTHPSYVVVYLTNLHTKMTFADGTINDNVRKAGDIAFREALMHTTENVEDKHAEEIQVELK